MRTGERIVGANACTKQKPIFLLRWLFCGPGLFQQYLMHAINAPLAYAPSTRIIVGSLTGIVEMPPRSDIALQHPTHIFCSPQIHPLRDAYKHFSSTRLAGLLYESAFVGHGYALIHHAFL